MIGVTTSELAPAGSSTLRRQGEPAHPEMALGMTYLQAIERAGAVPVVLPAAAGDLVSYIARLDGICLSGGPDLDPDAYGAPSVTPSSAPPSPGWTPSSSSSRARRRARACPCSASAAARRL